MVHLRALLGALGEGQGLFTSGIKNLRWYLKLGMGSINSLCQHSL